MSPTQHPNLQPDRLTQVTKTAVVFFSLLKLVKCLGMGAMCDTGPDYLVTALIKFTSYSIGGIMRRFIQDSLEEPLLLAFRAALTYLFSLSGETEVCQEQLDV